MRLPTPRTLREVAEFLERGFAGNPDHEITGFNEINSVQPGDLIYVDHPKYLDAGLASVASTLLVRESVDSRGNASHTDKGLILSPDPFGDFNRLCRHHAPFHPATAAISETAEIGEGTVIQPHVTIGANVHIGDHCIIQSGVVLHDGTWIGNHVILAANTVIGSDAFYFNRRPDGYERMHSCGRVVIEDRVEIGAACTLDRGVTAETRIGHGTKIDNMVHIGHDTVVGKNCLIAAQVGIAGCVVIEDNVTIWGQVGIPSKVRIGERAVLLAQSGITKDLAGDKAYFGSPADDASTRYREMAALRKLPELLGGGARGGLRIAGARPALPRRAPRDHKERTEDGVEIAQSQGE